MGRKKAESVGLLEENDVETVTHNTTEAVADAMRVVAAGAPNRSDVGWNDYVMEKFAPEELVEGNPTVQGLRRVIQLVIGPILSSEANLKYFNLEHGLPVAVVEHCVVVQDELYGMKRQVTEVADVNHINTDSLFARFATSTASTRAEGRALRKLLNLNRVCAEELTTVEVQEPGSINPFQINFIDKIASRADINVVKFVNMGKTKYSSIREIPHDVAAKMSAHLSELQRDMTKIPQEIKGYDSNWRNS